MPSEILDKFGRFLIENSFNKGLNKIESLIKGELKTYKNLQKEVSKFNNKQLVTLKRCFVTMFNEALHDLLFALQESYENNKDINIIVDGKNIAELSDGLNGELYSDEGWYVKFSNYKGDPSEID